MGRDKGLLLRGSQTWAELAHDRLTSVCEAVFVSIRSAQAESYGRIFDPHVLVADTRMDVEGPMRGILSAFDHFPSDYIVLACDLSDLEVSLLNLLASARTENLDALCIAFQTDRIQPLCAFYSKEALTEMSQPRDDFSLERFLKSRRALLLDPGPLAGQLRNYNAGP